MSRPWKGSLTCLVLISARSKIASKAYDVINRNFTLELEAKETEVEKIDSMLLQVQKSLHLVRYAAVANLYSGPNITGPPGQVIYSRHLNIVIRYVCMTSTL